MKLAVLINARLGSKRLPHKHIKMIGTPLAQQEAICHLIDRLHEFPIIIATGQKTHNEALGEIALRKHVGIYYGDPDNIPKRHLQIALDRDLDAIVSVDADDLLTSPNAVADVVAALMRGIPLVRTEGLPYGMNVLWAYSTKMLKWCMEKHENLKVLDTGWGWIFPPPYTIRYDIAGADLVQISLDYQSDLDKFSQIIPHCPYLDSDRRLTAWIIANVCIT